MSRLALLAGVCAFIALSSGTARAQAPGAGGLRAPHLALGGATASSLPNGFPLVTSGRLGISHPPVSQVIVARDALAAMRAASLRHRAPGVALMLVGAAGVVTGLLIDESLVTIAGAGVGLVGLYLYLR